MIFLSVCVCVCVWGGGGGGGGGYTLESIVLFSTTPLNFTETRPE